MKTYMGSMVPLVPPCYVFSSSSTVVFQPEVVEPSSPSIVSEPSLLQPLLSGAPNLALGCSGGWDMALTQGPPAQAGLMHLSAVIQFGGCRCRESHRAIT